MEIKYPNVKGRCTKAARRGGVSAEEIKAFQKEAMSGDYDNVLCTCMKWFSVIEQ
jgi:hypothetical protein